MSVTNCIGIDIAKGKLDACFLRPNGKRKDKTFENTASGYSRLLSWAKNLTGEVACHFSLEATGSYGEGVAIFLLEEKERVSVLNPVRVKYYGIARGVINKTDRVDAHLIALFCQTERPEVWRQSAPEVRLLSALVNRRQQLVEMRVSETNRLEPPGLLSEVRASLEKSVQHLSAEIKELDERIQSHIDQHPNLKADQDLLLSIPGIGVISSSVLLAELPTLSECTDSSAIGSFAGLSPREHRSGTSVHYTTHISKCGNVALRTALYFPAMTAIRYNSLVKAFYDRLVGRGKSRKAARCAAMRKLLMIVVGILKNRKPFDENYLSATP